MNEEEEDKRKWWQTIPGALGAFAGLITAITGLIIALQQIGVFTPESELNNGATVKPNSHIDRNNGVPSASHITTEELEPNNLFTEAKLIKVGSIVKGSIAPPGDRDIYKFITSDNKIGKVRIILRKTSKEGLIAEVRVYNQNEEKISDHGNIDNVIDPVSFSFK
jgi:hypothetical protein